MSAPSDRRTSVERKAVKEVKHNPYTAFTNDRERRRALMSRDLRLVLCTTVVVVWGPQVAPAVLRGLARIAIW